MLFKIVNQEILENPQEYVYSEVTFSVKLLNAKLLMSNFSAGFFIFNFFWHWFNAAPSQNAFISQEVFRDDQFYFENTATLNNNL